MRVKFTIPMMPPRECSANFRGHWRAKARTAKEWRAIAKMYTDLFVSCPVCYTEVEDAVVQSNWVIMDIEVEWCCGRKRMDDDNLIAACKPARDGIADALWGGEDRHVRMGDVTQRRGAGVTIVTLRQGEA